MRRFTARLSPCNLLPRGLIAALALCLLVGFGCGDDPAPTATATDSQADVAVDAGSDLAAVDVGSVTVKTDAVGPYAKQCEAGAQVCDDGNPCTTDGCDPVTGCTSVVRDCGDGDPCTIDVCNVASGDCQHQVEDCDDGNACTTGTCKAGQGCLFSATDCSDGDLCTADGCTPGGGCQHSKLNCDDGISCSVDSCDPTKGCVNAKPEGAKCCEAPIDCEDGDVCTAHSCVGGLCQNQAIFSCCSKKADCDDGNACTDDNCLTDNGSCTHTVLAKSGCCMVDLDCDDGAACTQDRCQGNTCDHEPICCSSKGDCGPLVVGAELCAAATCTDGSCGVVAVTTAGAGKAPATCCQDSVATANFDGDVSWKTTLIPSKTAAWSVVATGGKSGGGLKFAAVAGGTPGGGSLAQARFAAITLPIGVESTLTFSFIGTLGAGDQVRLRVVTSAGSWLIWQGSNVGSWATASIDMTGLGSRASTRNVQLWFEVVGAKGSSSGWILDDLAIASTCKPRTCSSAGQCSDNMGATSDNCSGGLCNYAPSKDYCENNSATCGDGDLCTTDVCSSFACLHLKVGNCCHNQSECDDFNPCTQDFCDGNNQCKHNLLPGDICCNTAADCGDGKVCTQDLCPSVGMPCQHTTTDANCCDTVKDCSDGNDCTLDSCGKNQCSHKNICCKIDADCNDGDDVCTSDACLAGKCAWTKLQKPECCDPSLFTTDFESGLPAAMVTGGTSAVVKWQPVTGKKAHSGSSSLYYGNPAAGNYDDNGAVSTGDVSWKTAFSLPAGEKLSFSFWLWMDTESGSYDNLTVQVVEAGALPSKAWDKSVATPSVTMQNWQQITVDLSAWAGKSVTVTLHFDTVDSIANGSEGVYLDDISLTRTCTAP